MPENIIRVPITLAVTRITVPVTYFAGGGGGASDVGQLTTSGMTAGYLLRVKAGGGLEERSPAQTRGDIGAQEAISNYSFIANLSGYPTAFPPADHDHSGQILNPLAVVAYYDEADPAAPFTDVSGDGITFYYGGTSAAGKLVSAALATNRTWTLPDAGGTLALTADLAAFAGSANIVTLGTIATGTWNGTAIGISYGGTGHAFGSSPAPELKTGAFTAVVGHTYQCAGTFSVTDPTSPAPAANDCYYVEVLSGSITIGGTAYIPSRFMVRRRHTGSAWETLPGQVSNGIAIGGATAWQSGATFSFASSTESDALLVAAGGGTKGIAIFKTATLAAAKEALGFYDAAEFVSSGNQTSANTTPVEVANMTLTLPVGIYEISAWAQFTNASSSSATYDVLCGAGIAFASASDRVGGGFSNASATSSRGSSSTNVVTLNLVGAQAGTDTNNVIMSTFVVNVTSQTTVKLRFFNAAATGTLTHKAARLSARKLN